MKKLIFLLFLCPVLAWGQSITPQFRVASPFGMSYTYPGLGHSDTLWNAQTIRGYVNNGTNPFTIYLKNYADSLHNAVFTLNNVYTGYPQFTVGAVGGIVGSGTYSSFNANGFDFTIGGSFASSYNSTNFNFNDSHTGYSWIISPNQNAITEGMNINLYLPNPHQSSDTIAVKSDISALSSGLVPYTGATSTLYSTKTIVSKDHMVQGDSLGYARLIAWGTSNTIAEGNANNTSDTSSYVYKTGKLKGMIGVNFGYSGRFTQKTIVGDSSLNDKIGKYVAPTTVRDVAILEGYPNDGKGDTTVYTAATYQTQATAVVNNLISIGWAADHIILLIPNYTNYNVLANHGNNYYRHTTYAAANTAIVSATGCKFIDYWTAFPRALLNSDSLHMTQAGHAWVAGRLTTDLTTFYGGATNYNNNRNVTVGNAVITNNTSIGGDLSVNGQFTPHKLILPNNLRVLNSINAGPSLILGGNVFVRDTTFINNANKSGGITGISYGVKPNAYGYQTVDLLSYLNTNVANTLSIGKGSSNTYALNAVSIYTSPTLNSNTGVLAVAISANGQATFTPNVSSSSGTSRGIQFAGTETATANNAILSGTYFNSAFSDGTGVNTATITTATTSAGDGTLTAQAAVNVTGTGSGAIFTITVLTGNVTVITQTTSGTGYVIGNTFTLAGAPGALFTVNTLGSLNVVRSVATFQGPKLDAAVATPTNFTNGLSWFESTGHKFRSNNTIYSVGSTTTLGATTATSANITGLTASQSVQTDASKNLVSVANTGSGSNVLATSPTLVTPALGTPSALVLTNATGLPTAGLVNNAVTYAKMQAMTTNKLLGSGSGTAVAEITLGTGLSFTGTTINASTVNRSHTIFTPTTGGTVVLVNNQYNIINPAGTLLALTVTLPSSPANNDIVQIKYTQSVTTVTYNGGTVVDGITSPVAGGYVILTYDSGTTSWY